MSDQPIVVLGAGGHAKVIIATLEAAGREVECILDDNSFLQGTRVLGIPVVGKMDSATGFRNHQAIIAVGDNRVRREIAERLDLDWTVALHPEATIHHSVTVMPGAVVFAGSVVQPGTSLGAHCIVNTGASIDHDCLIASYAHVGPGVHLGGSVWVGEGAFLGIASVVLPNHLVGQWSIVGGGAVATRDVQPRAVVVGVPATRIREKGLLSETENHEVNISEKAGGLQAGFIGPDDPRWRSILTRTAHDFYHLPAYVALAGKQDGYQPLAFYAEDAQGACLIPLLRRRLPARLEVSDSWCDLVSPYGYPTPIFTEPNDIERSETFMAAFLQTADALGTCSVFIRLHPVLSHDIPQAGRLSTCVTHGETAAVDLTRPAEEIWRETRSSHQYDIRRLERLKFTVVMDDWARFDQFVEMYRETMLRIGAGRNYWFDTPYFHELKAALGEGLHLCCVVSPEGKLAASGLFTGVGDIVQYHLSGSSSDFQKMAPTKLMLQYMRLWAKERGYRILHLGGGLGAGRDALFQFKAGFANKTETFRTLRIITNEQRYGILALRAGLNLNPVEDLSAEYFPPYFA